MAVFCAFATVQAAIATAIVRIGKGAPTEAPQFFGNPTFSLFVTVAGTCVASAILGLLLSGFAQTNEQNYITLTNPPGLNRYFAIEPLWP